jgi:hypothetical protein
MVNKNVEETLADACDMLVVLLDWMCCDNVIPNSTDDVCDERAVKKMCFRITVHPTSVNDRRKQG